MEDDGPLLSIGELAKRVRLPVRTIRFWSDAGVLPPTARTGGGRRLYDAACAARLELVVTLRELGLGLPDVRRVLDGQVSIAEVAAVHLDALDAQIRALRLHRSVLAVVVKRAADKEEMTLMNKLARMSVAERRQMIDDFLAEVFVGIDAARAPRWGAAWNLPDDPSPEQVDAWVELAELVSDPDFLPRRGCGRCRTLAGKSMPGTGCRTGSAGRTSTPWRQCCGGARRVPPRPPRY
jgi:DNA-binding transcriptional MerR regulator